MRYVLQGIAQRMGVIVGRVDAPFVPRSGNGDKFGINSEASADYDKDQIEPDHPSTSYS